MKRKWNKGFWLVILPVCWLIFIDSSPLRSYVMEMETSKTEKAVQLLTWLPLWRYVEADNTTSAFWNQEEFFRMAEDVQPVREAEKTSKKEQNSLSTTTTTTAKTKSVLSKSQLKDFSGMIKSYYAMSSTTYITEEDVDFYELSKMDMTLQQTDASKPQILIYHTHSQEGFLDSTQGDAATSIVAVGNYLTQLLTDMGYNVIHDTTSYDMVNGKLDRNQAYDYAREQISQILEDNPTIEVVLDIHRDGVAESTRLVTTINGKETAQILFFNGMSRITGVGDVDSLYNPYRTENLAMSLQMRIKALEAYPTLVRANYLNAYKYNLDLRPKAMLIEVGAQTNTLQEALNAMEPLTELLNGVLTGQ